MKCFEKLVRSHITSALPRSLDPHQFAYRANRSTEDAVATALHAALSHLEGQGNYVRMLFVDFSSAFNTISHTDCPLLYSLYTHDCSPVHQSNTIVKFADDTTVVGDIGVTSLPTGTSGQSVERVTNFRFLGVNIEDNLTWSANTSELLKKSQHRLYFLRTLRKNNITQRLLICFYRATIESIMTYCICIWYASSTAAQRNALQGVIKTAQKIVGCPLPTLEDLHRLRCVKKAHNIIRTPHTLATPCLNCCHQESGTDQ
ncbi:hypothetical protein D9C73_028553 [Collichthys lucidus]|uniref:Alkylated DNA repair protein AlkB homologue 8 N-terminal domain-containing protein n=1 Tax=Collichthys lucidus TaxID=240159 RepID=A0A4U5TWA9_COLLU|nr:hypothetical protein D9C73_028553 [Collichthys lucidus]